MGEVKLDLPAQNHTHCFSVHTTAVTQMVLNQSGTRLATSSEKGTMVRVFDTMTGKKLSEFRRGRTHFLLEMFLTL